MVLLNSNQDGGVDEEDDIFSFNEDDNIHDQFLNSKCSFQIQRGD